MNVEGQEPSITGIKTLIENNPTYSVTDMEHILGISSETVLKNLDELGYIYHSPYWIQKELNARTVIKRVSFCDSLRLLNARRSFLKRIITVFEKCIVYKMYISETEFDLKKAMVCIWWDWKGFICAKILPDTTIIDTNTYCSYLDELQSTIKEVRPELITKTIVYHHSKPCVMETLKIVLKIHELFSFLMIHAPYSSDLSPSDYYLSENLHSSLRNKHFTSFQEFENHINEFCESLNKLPENPLMALPERWQMVHDKTGQYIFS